MKPEAIQMAYQKPDFKEELPGIQFLISFMPPNVSFCRNYGFACTTQPVRNCVPYKS